MISEARVVKPSGTVVWVVLNRNNHFFDCEVSNIAAAYSLNLQAIVSTGVKRRNEAAARQRATKNVEQKNIQREPRSDPFRKNVGVGSSWFNRR